MPLYSLAGRRPAINSTAWVAPSAELIADVVLGEDASVWFGAVIRGDNTTITVGARSNVQEGVMMHSDAGVPMVVGDDCTIGHHAILHGCTIGNATLIGMGAVVLNRAVIADHCIVGAKALVTEGKSFPAGSLIVGQPARAVRQLDPSAIAALTISAAHYVAKARLYARELVRVD